MEEQSKKTYKESIDRLKQIVVDVQDENLELEDSLDLLEEGVKLANYCIGQVDLAKTLEDEEMSEGEKINDSVEEHEDLSANDEESVQAEDEVKIEKETSVGDTDIWEEEENETDLSE